jgi:O-antigen ligase
MTSSVFALGAIIFVLGMARPKMVSNLVKSMKTNLLVHLLSISLLISTLMSSIKVGLVTCDGLVAVILRILSFYIIYLFLPQVIVKDIDTKTNKLILLISLFSVMAIIIKIRGSFLNYTMYYTRAASIFFDPNYFAVLCGIGVILSAYKKGRYKFFAAVNLIALIFSGSRAAYISLIFVTIISFLYRKKLSVGRIFLILFLSFSIYCLTGFLYNIDYFRVYQGLNRRDYLWEISFDFIKSEPLWGYGYGAVGYLIRSRGDLHASSHNTYVDYILMYGIPSFIIYTMIIMKAVYLGVKNKVPEYVMMSVLFTLINSNSITISLGGLSANSLLFTLFLGICNASKKENISYQNNGIQSTVKVKR